MTKQDQASDYTEAAIEQATRGSGRCSSRWRAI